MMINFQQILEKIAIYKPDYKHDLLLKAFTYATKAHSGQYRLSGDPYIDHILTVTDILLSLKPGENAVIACLFHALPQTDSYNLKEIETLFGKDVANLVSALETMNKIKSTDQKAEVESLRKMFLVMAQDLRVVLIKLADRVDSMQTLDFHQVLRRKRIARETLDIYVPIASRLGIFNLKTRLEDLCFKYLYPSQYGALQRELNEYIQQRGKNIDEIKNELGSLLKLNGFEVEIEGRIKNLYSIYKKLKLKNHSGIADIYDVFAMRIILATQYNKDGEEINDNLYAILGLIHSKWKPLVNRFKDYAALAKPNGYQSIHTAVLGLSPKSFNQPTEIQIRSRRMHDQAEYGIASHWLYEKNKKIFANFSRDSLLHLIDNNPDLVGKNDLDWVQMLAKMQNEANSGKELLQSLKLDVFNDRIFVFTPTGEVKDLPSGSTPIDFAYAVHSNIGNHSQVSKVNGSVVPLSYHLKNGDVVEIVINNKATPKPHWLSMVKTAGAKSKIRAYLRSLDKDYSFREGKEIINKILAKMDRPLLDDDLTILREYSGKKLSFKERIQMVEEIGSGSVPALPIIKKIFSSDKSFLPETKPTPNLDRLRGKFILPQTKSSKLSKGDGVYIAGESGLPYRFANCCKPVVGSPIVGFITRGNAVSIHSQSCKVLASSEQERVIDASWRKDSDLKKYLVKININAKNRVGLIRDIAEVIISGNVNILDFGKVKDGQKEFQRELVLEVIDNDQLTKVLERLQRVRDVYDVNKTD